MAIRRWEAVLYRFNATAQPKIYSRLAIAYRESGDISSAHDVLIRGMDRYTDDAKLVIEWSQLAMVEENWIEAIRRWEHVLESFGHDVEPKVYAWLAIAYRQTGRRDMAATVVDWGRARFPDEASLAIEWAQLAMMNKDWQEAALRWEEVLSSSDEKAPSKVYAWLGISYREQGNLDAAAKAIRAGLARFPNDPKLAMEWAQLALEEGNFTEAIHRWEAVISSFSDVVPPKVYARLAVEYRHQQDTKSAQDIIREGRERFPDDIALATESAHVAMVQGDWITAINRWQEVVTLSCRADNHRSVHNFLPLCAPNLDWNENAWIELSLAWIHHQDQHWFQPSPSLYEAVGHALTRIKAFDEAEQLLILGLSRYPTNNMLRYELLLCEISRSGTHRVDPHQYFQDHASTPSDTIHIASEDFDRNLEVLNSFAPTGPTDRTLTRIHRIRVPRGSTLELLVRSGRYYTRATANRRVLELSERHEWEEISDGPNPIATLARRLSNEYARRFQHLPYLGASVLSDAVFFLIYSELLVYEPMRRLAKQIAREGREDPVFVEFPRGVVSYLNGYATSNFDLLYLYFELRRYGVNAFLCQYFEPSRLARSGDGHLASRRLPVAPIIFEPSGTLMQARKAKVDPDPGQRSAAIIPAGMRSVEKVIDLVGSPLLYSSGFLTQRFAYDRSYRKWVAIEPNATIHPQRSLLKRVRVEMWHAATLIGSQIAGNDFDTVEASVDVSVRSERDWLGWLNHTLHEYLLDLARRSHAEVLLREVREAHVADHLFAEAAIFAGAVRAAGGRVELWPHSANPAHDDVRDPRSFDAVHAITRTGCDRWQSIFPHVQVIHSPELMLDIPRLDNIIDPQRNLSVIVLGGQSILGSMPMLNQTLHQASYRSFFQGLEKLQRDLPIDVYYKPKGLKGENESWLRDIVGSCANWKRVLEHPLRMSLPNMLFVSISVGTSALLEGLSRGIPCLVVKDFPARDYTTLSAGTIPMGSSEEMVDVVRHCASGGLRALLTQQLDYYQREAALMDGHASHTVS